MRTGVIAALAALLLSSCAGWLRDAPEARLDGAGEAIKLVWGQYGHDSEAPVVRILTPANIPARERCMTSAGKAGFISPIGSHCIDGLTTPAFGNGGCALYVVAGPGDVPSTTTLAHEMLHCQRLRSFAIPPHHSEGSWDAPQDRDDAFYSAVDTANTLLTEHGL